jgi:hypothetical protein
MKINTGFSSSSSSATYLGLIFFLLFSSYINGQGEKELLREMMEEDRSVVDALVMYPEDSRNDIFQISTHPELIIRIQSLQSRTKDRFLKILESHSQENQEKFYNLLRYKGLLSALTEGEKKSGKDIDKILTSYPEESHEIAKELYKKELETLQAIHALDLEVRASFNELISTYPERSQVAARNLVEFPETLSLLADNINLTILIGDLYSKEPDWVQYKADSLNLVLARQEVEELEDYKKQLEEDPEAYNEMLEAAEQYSSDNSIEKYNQEIDTDPTTTVTHHYSYWYGYPHWYTTPLWAPVPWYYHTGFYYGPGGGVVFIGMPSPYYIGWHYRYYPNRYVYLNTHYHRHYYRHPYSRGGFHQSINVNINRNNNIIVNKRYDNRNVDIGNNNRVGNRNQNRDQFDSKNGNKNKNSTNRSVDRSKAKSTTRNSYDRHKAYQNHSSKWSNRSASRSGSRSTGTRRGRG